jgi:hypothetical protein
MNSFKQPFISTFADYYLHRDVTVAGKIWSFESRLLERTSTISAINSCVLLDPAALSGLGCAVMAAFASFPAVLRLPVSVAYAFLASRYVGCAPCKAFVRERVTIRQRVSIVALGLWLTAR